MTADGAKSAVTISAVVVGGTFAYRKITSPAGTPTTSHFLLGFMVVYITLSILADAAPEIGGMGAALVAVGDLLTNGTAITNDLNRGLKATAAATKPTATTA
jgi:hypothetical protein